MSDVPPPDEHRGPHFLPPESVLGDPTPGPSGGPPPPSGSLISIEPLPEHRPLTRAAQVTKVFVVLCLVGAVPAIVASVSQYRLLGRLERGEPVTINEVERSDAWVILTGGIVLALVLVAAVAAVVWFHRAYRNLENEHTTKHRPGWAIGAWCVPFLNLWRPAKIMEELLDDARRHGPARTWSPLWLWWVPLVANRFLDRVSRAISRGDTIASFRQSIVVDLLGWATWLVAGVFFVFLVVEITAVQTDRRTGSRTWQPEAL